MRIGYAFFMAGVCGAALGLQPVTAKADGGVITAATVGFVGGTILARYYAPYFYNPATPPPPATTPTYTYLGPYYITAPCWGRRLPVYDRFGDVIAIKYEQACR